MKKKEKTQNLCRRREKGNIKMKGQERNKKKGKQRSEEANKRKKIRVTIIQYGSR